MNHPYNFHQKSFKNNLCNLIPLESIEEEISPKKKASNLLLIEELLKRPLKDQIKTIEEPSSPKDLKETLAKISSGNDEIQFSALLDHVRSHLEFTKEMQNKDQILNTLKLFDQYEVNDNSQFLSKMLTILFKFDDEVYGSPEICEVIIKLLLKKLANTNDNYINCNIISKKANQAVSKLKYTMKAVRNDDNVFQSVDQLVKLGRFHNRTIEALENKTNILQHQLEIFKQSIGVKIYNFDMKLEMMEKAKKDLLPGNKIDLLDESLRHSSIQTHDNSRNWPTMADKNPAILLNRPFTRPDSNRCKFMPGFPDGNIKRNGDMSGEQILESGELGCEYFQQKYVPQPNMNNQMGHGFKDMFSRDLGLTPNQNINMNLTGKRDHWDFMQQHPSMVQNQNNSRNLFQPTRLMTTSKNTPKIKPPKIEQSKRKDLRFWTTKKAIFCWDGEFNLQLVTQELVINLSTLLGDMVIPQEPVLKGLKLKAFTKSKTNPNLLAMRLNLNERYVPLIQNAWKTGSPSFFFKLKVDLLQKNWIRFKKNFTLKDEDRTIEKMKKFPARYNFSQATHFLQSDHLNMDNINSEILNCLKKKMG